MAGEPLPSALVGRALGHYDVLAMLGRGGMGVVYLAEDRRLHRRVALKVLPHEMSQDPDRLKRFRREAKTVASLNHPNIVTLHSVEEAEGIHYLTMELVEGRTLADEIPPTGLPVRRVLEIGIALAEALTAAHESGVLHRDLKPANVMVGPRGWVKVLDFGLAKLRPEDEATRVEDHGTSLLHTQEGRIMGTPSYMAPEQLRGLLIDERADLFTLGLLLHEMIAGVQPFAGETSAERIAAVLRDPPAALETSRPDIPTPLARLVARCLEKNREHRPASAAEIRDELVRIQRDLEISSLVESGILPARAEKPRDRRWEITGAVLAFVALVAFGISRLSWESTAPATNPVVAERPRPAVAVLPFGNFSGEAEYFVDGMTDALIGALAEIRGLRVISRQSIMRFKGSDRSLPEIARELGVEYVVEGSVARSGEQVRISVQLLRAEPEQHLMARAVESSASDLLLLHGRVAREIASEVHVRLSPEEEARFAAVAPLDPALYEAYLKGRYFLNRRTPDGYFRALEQFQAALALDADYAPALVGLADTYALLGYLQASAEETGPRAREAIERALLLDPGSAEAHATRGLVRLYFDWDWRTAESDLRRALDLNPNLAKAHFLLWAQQVVARQPVQAEASIRRALELDPLSLALRTNLGVHRTVVGDVGGARDALRQALDLDPDYGPAIYTLSTLETHAGQEAEAISALVRALPLYGYPELVEPVKQAFARGGLAAAWRATAEQLEQVARRRQVPSFLIAAAFTCAGEASRALDWLEVGYERRDPVLINLAVDPDWAPLRNERRFERLKSRIGVP